MGSKPSEFQNVFVHFASPMSGKNGVTHSTDAINNNNAQQNNANIVESPKSDRVRKQLEMNLNASMLPPIELTGNDSDHRTTRSKRNRKYSPLTSNPNNATDSKFKASHECNNAMRQSTNKRKVRKHFSTDIIQENPDLRLVLVPEIYIENYDNSPIYKLLEINKSKLKQFQKLNEPIDIVKNGLDEISNDLIVFDVEDGLKENHKNDTSQSEKHNDTFTLTCNQKSEIIIPIDDSNADPTETADATNDGNVQNDQSFLRLNESDVDLSLEINNVKMVDSDEGVETSEKIVVTEANNKNEPPAEKPMKKVSVDDLEAAHRSSEFHLGDLIWASQNSFWPAIVCNDPMEPNKFEDSDKVHVTFFADNSRRAWIRKRATLKYSGKGEFEQLRKSIEKLRLSKHQQKRFIKCYRKPMSASMWVLAVAEADLVSTISREFRYEFYTQILISAIRKLKNSCNAVAIPDRCATSTPCTFDTAYSSMKHSASPASSLEQWPMQQTYIEDRIETYLKSLNEEDEMTDNDKASTSSDVKEPSPATSFSCESMTRSQLSPWHDKLRNAILKQAGDTNIINDDQFNSFSHVLRQFWTSKAISNRKRKGTSEASASTSSSNSSGKKDVKVRRQNDDTLIQTTFCTKFGRTINRSIDRFENQSVFTVEEQPKRKNDEELIEKKRQERERLLKKREEVFDKLIMKKRPANYILRDLPKEPICDICLRPGDVFVCSSGCGKYFHTLCADGNRTDRSKDWYKDLQKHLKRESEKTIDLVTGDDFQPPSTLCEKPKQSEIGCDDCKNEQLPNCFICNIKDEQQILCSEKQCGRAYHVSCFKYWPQNKVTYTGANAKSVLCPRHVCHTCISEDPKQFYTNVENCKRLIRCVFCPASYHRISTCIPAGSELLSESQLVCPRHRTNKSRPVNVDWCFLCSKGGSLLCCETCPSAFHVECLKFQPPGGYICEECESGRMPLYGEIVWSKYRKCKNWWPGMLVPPPQIPDNVLKQKPGANFFCIYFFGTYNYGWLCRDYVYIYDEADGLCKSQHLDGPFCKALEDARKWYKVIKETENRYGCRKVQNILKPTPYKKITINQYVPPAKFIIDEESSETACNCMPDDASPCGDSDCMNRACQIECNVECKAMDKCQNQRFQRRSNVKLELKNFDSKGWGLLALETIPKDTFLIEYVGEVIVADEFQLRFNRTIQQKEKNFYFLTMGNGLYLDAGNKGNLARFINHSCEPNCVPQKWVVNGQTRIGLFSCVDIPANTEVTFNYNWDDFLGNKTVCYCKAKSCSGFLGSKNKTAKRTSSKESDEKAAPSKKFKKSS